MLECVMPAPGRIRMRSLAIAMSSANFAAPSSAVLNHLFQSFSLVGAFVERAMKRHRQRPREIDESSRSADIHFETLLQDAEHHAIHPAFGGDGNGALHFGELGVRVNK